MFDVSDDFLAAIQDSHVISTKVEIWSSAGELVESDLAVGSGFIRIEKGRDVRRSCDVRLFDTTGDMTPDEASDLLHVGSGNELKLYRGVKFPDGTTELVPLGLFRIEDTNVDDSGDQVNISCSAMDRSKRVSDAKMRNSYYVAAGTNYATAIKNLISSRAPWVTYNFSATSYTTPILWLRTGEDPWRAAVNWAASIGMDLFFDANGILVMRQEASPNAAPVWEFIDDSDSTMLYVNRRLVREGAFNVVVVTGQSDKDSTVRGEAVDNDATSITYLYGPFGEVVRHISTDKVTTVDQARAMAAAELAKTVGIPESMRLATIPNPALEDGDVIEITRADSKLSAANYIVDGLTIPLEPTQTMWLTCRLRRVLT